MHQMYYKNGPAKGVVAEVQSVQDVLQFPGGHYVIAGSINTYGQKQCLLKWQRED